MPPGSMTQRNIRVSLVCLLSFIAFTSLGNTGAEKDLAKIYRYMSRGKTSKIYPLVTENSKLSVILYGKRFCHNYLIFNRKVIPEFELIDAKHVTVNRDLSYLLVNIRITNPENGINFSREELLNSLSPWAIQLHDDIYYDSIAIHHGKIEFNYGRDANLYWLSGVRTAWSNVEWLNIREGPSRSARIIGKLKSPGSGEIYDMSEINGVNLVDSRYTAFAVDGIQQNGYILCYFLDETDGNYYSGFVWKEYLFIADRLYE